ncbi:hypothetical protein [Nocardioides sp. CFH 31398]|uniref:hypothetical protein n=1 Tax=Nocardioides sp. CFH 31398 TaxID=2919579 RepID=UPI001F055BA3|nr:hypothetical protein [Nocardioides sp. CFH 31398]MCH1867078.1 hypothetical protein [Nocardioides sp. CFH 31398]
MSARVYDLTSRLPQPCDCPPHRLASLAARLRESSDAQAGELLIPAQAFADVIDDALEVLDRIVADHAPTHERGTR